LLCSVVKLISYSPGSAETLRALNAVVLLATERLNDTHVMSQLHRSFFIAVAHILDRNDLIPQLYSQLDSHHAQRALPLLLYTLARNGDIHTANTLYTPDIFTPLIIYDSVRLIFNSIVHGDRFWLMLGRQYLVDNQPSDIPLALDYFVSLVSPNRIQVAGYYCGLAKGDTQKQLLDLMIEQQPKLTFMSGLLSGLTLTRNIDMRNEAFDAFTRAISTAIVRTKFTFRQQHPVHSTVLPFIIRLIPRG